MAERIGVTGASGFLGQRIVRELVRRGIPVRAFGRRDPGPDSSDGLVEGGSLDLLEPIARGAFDGLSGVVHAAAYVPSRSEGLSEARRCVEVNALGTLALLQASVEAGLGTFVLISAGNVYASGPGPFGEDAPIFPGRHAAFYLGSKVLSEFYLEHARTLPSAPRLVSLRPSAIYGPGVRRGVMRTFYDRLARGEPVQLTNGGLHEADFVHVDDVAWAAVEALTRSVDVPLNIGAGRSRAILDVATVLAARLGAPRALIQVAPAEAGATGFGALEISRARELLGYEPRDLETGIADWISECGSGA